MVMFQISVEKEPCVVCHAVTNYSYRTPIQERNYYVEGVGQLCEKCYADVILEYNRQRDYLCPHNL